VWQFLPNASLADLESPPPITKWAGPGTKSINVPFPVESNLSGIESLIGQTGVGFYRLYTDQRILPPRSPDCTRMLLHIEASDWETHVWVNGYKQHPVFPLDSRIYQNTSSNETAFAYYHRGGYNRITFDVTSSITGPCDFNNKHKKTESFCPPGNMPSIFNLKHSL
jgi:hypothetical protein